MTPINTLLLNGHPKATAIVRFDHTAVIIFMAKTLKRVEFPNVQKMKEFIDEKGLEVNLEHIHPGGVKQ